MKILKKTLSILLAASMAVSAGLITAQAEDEQKTPVSVVVEPKNNKAASGLKQLNKSDWTIGVYMCGTDLESGGGAATNDLIEMLEADIPDDVTLLVMTGGTKTWNPNKADETAVEDGRIKKGAYLTPDNEHTQIYRVDDDKMSLVYTYDENLNMGSAQTLGEFAEFILAYAPSENLMLECWDHGGGPVGGAEKDEYTGDIIPISDISRAAEAVYKARGEKTEIFGFDTCLTSNIETVSALAPYAEYLVASEEVEPGTGWYYQWLSVFNEANKANRTAEPVEIGKRIVDEYGKTNNLEDTWKDSTELTLNLIDLSRAPKVLEAFDNMAKELNQKLDNPDEYAAVARTAEDVQKTYSGVTGVMDLYDFANKQKDNLKSAQALIDAIGTPPGNTPEYFVGDVKGNEPMVLYRGTGAALNECLGVGFYYPTIKTVIGSTETAASETADIYDSLSVSENYSKYLREILLKTDKLQNFTGNIRTHADASGEAVFYMEITPAESGKAIKDVSATCQLKKKNSDGSETTYKLGDTEVEKDWENLRFTDKFDGTWDSINGQFFTLNKEYVFGGAVIIYLIPVKIEGREEVSMIQALAAAEEPENAYIISIADVDTEMGITDRTFTPEGDLTFRTLLCEAEDSTKYICNDPVTLKPQADENGNQDYVLNITKSPLTSGKDIEYDTYFKVTDMKGTEFLSDPCGYVMSEDIEDFSIKDIPTQICTGKPVEPKITLMMGEHELFLNKNYLVEYSNNTEKGTAKVTLTMKDNDEVFATLEKNFEIADVSSIFKDVKTDDWYFDSVAYMHTNGYMNGVADGKFAPNNEITRAMFAQMLYRYADEQNYKGEVGFEDVKDDAYYAAAVGWAKKNGIISGVSETKFDPDAKITRESAAAMLYRYADYKKMNTEAKGDISKYEDKSLISDWAQENVKWAVGNGLMNGRSEAELAPKGSVTRAETAKLMENFNKIGK